MSTIFVDPDVLQETSKQLEQQTAVEPPFKVLIHNDDVTPYDFVVWVLQSIFQLDTLAAELITYSAHVTGLALVTVLPKTEAERKVGKAHFAAQLEGFPLTFSIEPE